MIKFAYIRPFSQIDLVRAEFNLYTLSKIPCNPYEQNLIHMSRILLHIYS
jgi:hypothetical protein